MSKKDVIFLATTLMLSSHKLTAPTENTNTDTLKSSYLNWYQFLSEIYEECSTDSQN